MNTNQKGDIAEAYTTARLIEKGYTVSEPVNDHSRYDFVVDIDGELHKIQTKYAELDETGCIKVSIASSNPNTKTSIDKKYTEDEVDAYTVYCPNTDKVYWIKFEDAPKHKMRLRVESENNDKKINWASNYTLNNI